MCPDEHLERLCPRESALRQNVERSLNLFDTRREDTYARARAEERRHSGQRIPRLKESKKTLFFDIWEKWGRHIWEKGLLGILLVFFLFWVN